MSAATLLFLLIKNHRSESDPGRSFSGGPLLESMLDRVERVLDMDYEAHLQLTSVLTKVYPPPPPIHTVHHTHDHQDFSKLCDEGPMKKNKRLMQLRYNYLR